MIVIMIITMIIMSGTWEFLLIWCPELRLTPNGTQSKDDAPKLDMDESLTWGMLPVSK